MPGTWRPGNRQQHTGGGNDRADQSHPDKGPVLPAEKRHDDADGGARYERRQLDPRLLSKAHLPRDQRTVLGDETIEHERDACHDDDPV
jgi:hypothetical protein